MAALYLPSVGMSMATRASPQNACHATPAQVPAPSSAVSTPATEPWANGDPIRSSLTYQGRHSSEVC